ncbi:Retrovirus-related Pol polyprotein from transposon TNT 1-94 [Porphyridium purpureum]|uniref:Retrovirus-related Pol polyprotein from transposon TNT 1-94 n=1 Tax=Porphyridium purpureum TaxID=35688 RepID=A0A5J4Z3A7_PORPP|nr:Retrovirus-related Pol polyprotein from transposon TNT 1-94 [Porphyridium purpureum]|eukprot:POR4570..scf295_1
MESHEMEMNVPQENAAWIEAANQLHARIAGQEMMMGMSSREMWGDWCGIRANLVQAGLGKRWFMHAAQHFAFMTNRLHVGRKSGKTPFELRHGEKWSPRNLSLPFGCKVVYKDDQPDNKYAPRGKVGILVGVGEHPMALLVLPRDDWTSETPKVIRTQDFKAFTHEFPLKGIEREMVSLSQQEELPEVDEPSAVEAVQDLDRRIDALRTREAELEKEIEALKVRVVDEERAAGTGGPVAIPQLNLTTLLKTGAALASEQGRAAMEKEVKSMLKFGVWDESPLTLEEARRQPGARFVRTHFIFGLKFAEMPEEFRKVKCRLVAGGNRIWGSDGAATNDIFDYETPAGLSAIRMIIAVAAILGLQIVSFDISSAYLHADLSGPPTFAYLPREICDSKGTVVRLRKALYGLPRSGSDFSQDARRRLQKFQWKLVHGEKNVYVRRNAASSSVALLALYVDDGLLACREEERPGIIEELKQEFLMEKAPELLTEGGSLRFLGTSISLKNGSVSLANQEYQDVVVREFEQDIRRVLRAVKSPSEKLDGEEVLNYQVIWKTLKVREHVGRLMWLARTVRPDIAYAVGMIARYVDKWNMAAERLLVRVVQYLKTPREALEYHVLGNLKEGIRGVNIVGYTDADFAGCPESRVSTSGRATYLVAGDYKYLVDWSSRKKRFVSSSTSESELAALEETVQLSLFPALSFLRSIRDGEFSVILMCDNQAVMRVIEMGYSPKLHHMAITRATDLAWLHQVCEKQKLVKLVFVKTDENVADLMTKALFPEGHIKCWEKLRVGIPYRPNSHAEQQRFHHTLNQGIRANLVQAGLGKRWFMHAAQHFAFMTNRLHVGRKSGKTPFELRHGEKWSPRNLSLPFGCKVVYKDDQPDNKYAPRGKVGILVGVGEHPMAILVLPRDDWTSETPKVIRTQDFKAFTHEFPLKGIEREMVSLSQQEELPEVDEPSAVEAVQDLDRRIDALRAREAELEKEIEALKVRVVDEERAAGTGGPVTIPQLNLTTLLKTGAALASEQGRAAMEKEVKSMLKFGVWDESPLTLEEARRQPGARFVRTHFIFGLKFAEMPEEFRKGKCRLVAGGNRIWGSDGAATNDIFDYETPAGLSAIRMIIAVAAILGLQIVSFDISSAYLHADLSGPPTFAYLPREICDSKGTVVRLRKALYGLPRSGSDFSQDARRRLQKFQWKLVHGEKNVYVRRNAASSSVALLALYVDDGLLACREEERPGIIEELKQEFLIEKAPELLTEGGSLRFLGTSISLKNGSVSLANQEYQDVVIREFEQDIRRVLRAVKSPSEKLDGEEVLNYQVIWKTLKVREHVGRLMWLARTVRPDIAYAVGMIARYVDKWNVAAERLLVRVVQYLKTPREALEYHVLGNLKEGIRGVNILGYTDADFAGCPESRVSTSGRATYLVAGDYKYLVDWSSRKQRFVSSSTSESELAALEETVQLSLFPALSFLRSIRDGEFSVILMCDNQAVMRAIEMGYSPKLHHMAITRATDLAWLHQVCEKQKLVKLAFVKTDENVADLMTKALFPEGHIKCWEKLRVPQTGRRSVEF